MQADKEFGTNCITLPSLVEVRADDKLGACQYRQTGSYGIQYRPRSNHDIRLILMEVANSRMTSSAFRDRECQLDAVQTACNDCVAGL